jgi:hypothetical protein
MRRITMNSTLSSIIGFSIGAAVGAFVTWRLVTEKYNKILEERLSEIEETENFKNPDKVAVDETKRTEYTQVVADLGYSKENEKKGEQFAEDPLSVVHIIDPLEMNDDTDFEVEYCTYYVNDILTDREDNIMDIETTIGLQALERFDEYDRNMVYVRNDETHKYYEVLRVDVMYDPE